MTTAITALWVPAVVDKRLTLSTVSSIYGKGTLGTLSHPVELQVTEDSGRGGVIVFGSAPLVSP